MENDILEFSRLNSFNSTFIEIQTRLLNILEFNRLNSLNSSPIKIKELNNIKTLLTENSRNINPLDLKESMVKQICTVMILAWHLQLDVGKELDNFLATHELENCCAN